MNKISKKPLVSVLIPVFNGSEYLVETVESVQKSTYKNFEIILVDDGSTDKSRKVCAALTKRYKKVHFYSFDSNKGMTRSLNFGISKAKGKYIARINQDDIMLPSRLAKQVDYLEKNRGSVAAGGYIKLFTDKNKNFGTVKFPLTDKAIRKIWLYLSPYSDPTVMFRKAAFKKTKGYSQKFWPADDVHMWYQMGKIGSLANLPYALTKVRWHKGAGSFKYHSVQMRKTWEVHQWAKKNVENPNVLIKTFWVGQYLAGVVFPPQVNWFVYRLIRRIMEIDTKLISQPIRASLSGAYNA